MSDKQHQIAEDFLAALGKVTFNFSALEYTIKLFIWSLVSEPDQLIQQCITAELSFANLVKLLSSLHLVRETDESAIAELDGILTRAFQVEERRNAITHSNWGPNANSDGYVRIKTTAKKSKGLRWQFEELTVNDINNIALSVGQVAADLQSYMKKMKYDF